jgi:drug/metabolite transporter (DMT)-like permease
MVLRTHTLLLTLLAMLAFAGNSLLCRVALKGTAIDPATFTSIRIVSGAVALWLLVSTRSSGFKPAGSWRSAAALFGYAAAFSFAYVDLSAGTGALLLFGAVQATMILQGLRNGERLRSLQLIGLAMALGGLVALLLPGLEAPPFVSASLMVAAGIAWGVYSLRGRGMQDPLAATADNFLRAVPFTLILSIALAMKAQVDWKGASYAVASGALTSGVGYAVWYAALRGLKSTGAATVQLSVPIIAAIGGILLLGEPLTLRLVGASIAVLGGIALVIRPKPNSRVG